MAKFLNKKVKDLENRVTALEYLLEKGTLNDAIYENSTRACQDVLRMQVEDDGETLQRLQEDVVELAGIFRKREITIATVINKMHNKCKRYRQLVREHRRSLMFLGKQGEEFRFLIENVSSD